MLVYNNGTDITGTLLQDVVLKPFSANGFIELQPNTKTLLLLPYKTNIQVNINAGANDGCKIYEVLAEEYILNNEDWTYYTKDISEAKGSKAIIINHYVIGVIIDTTNNNNNISINVLFK